MSFHPRLPVRRHGCMALMVKFGADPQGDDCHPSLQSKSVNFRCSQYLCQGWRHLLAIAHPRDREEVHLLQANPLMWTHGCVFCSQRAAQRRRWTARRPCAKAVSGLFDNKQNSAVRGYAITTDERNARSSTTAATALCRTLYRGFRRSERGRGSAA